MTKTTKLLLGASSLAMLTLSAFTLQGCSDSDDTSSTPAAGSSSVAGAAGSSVAGASAAGSDNAGSAGALPAGGDSAAGAAGAAGAAAGAAGEGGLGGAVGTVGSGGTADVGGTAGVGGTSGSAGTGGGTSTAFSIRSAGTVGQVLATTSGFTLYVFASDTPSTTAPVSACADDCLTSWPAYYVDPSASVPDGVSAGDFGSFSNNGTLQSTYMGWPLYTYFGDTAPGMANGQGVSGTFFAVTIPFTAPD